MTDPLLIFLHLPKTAGTAFRHVMERHYRPTQIYDFEAGDETRAAKLLGAIPEKRWKQLRVISGHLPYDIHRLVPRPCQYMTILRDPYERVVSMYFHIKRTHHHYCHDEVAGKKMTLSEFVTSGLSLETDNAQTRMLAGAKQPDFGECDDAMLKRALRNLRKDFILTGLTERFEQTALLAQSVLQWKKLPLYRVSGRGWNRDDKRVSETDRDAVLAWNRLDVKLYEAVDKMLDEQCAQQCPDWEKRLGSFRRRNAIFRVTKRSTKVVRGLLKI